MAKRTACRVALLYHDPLLRDIVRHVFGAVADIKIVAELPVGETPIKELVAAQPDVVVVDRRTMEDSLPTTLSSLLATLVEHQPGIRVIALSLAEAKVTVFSGWQVSNVSVDSLVACVRGADPTPATRPKTRRRKQQAG